MCSVMIPFRYHVCWFLDRSKIFHSYRDVAVFCWGAKYYTGWKFSFSQLKHFWMSTEYSRNVHWNPDFRHCSVTFQWTFSPTECCWMAGTFQWPFSIFFLFSGYQIRGIKLILLLFTTHEINKKNKLCPRPGSNQGIFVLVVPNPVR